MIKKIIIILVVFLLLVVGAIVLFRRGDSATGVKSARDSVEKSEQADAESITLDGIATDKSGNLVLPNKMPADTNSGQPIMWIE